MKDKTMEEEKKTGIRKISSVELGSLRLHGNRKAKKTKSLFDTNSVDRSFWGNDPGTDLEMAMTRVEISRSLNKGEMLDIKNCSKAAHLSHASIMKLMEEQFHLMTLIADENDCNIFTNINQDGFVMVELDSETNQYNFVFVK
jgi:hypothetical protein